MVRVRSPAFSTTIDFGLFFAVSADKPTHPMKRSIIISIAAILMLLATARIFLKTENKIESEMQSYVRNLHYDFSATIDSVILVHEKKGVGFVVGNVTNGNCNRSVEDSLNRHLTNYKRIRFLHFQTDGRFRIFLGRISRYKPGDSIVVNSNEDKFTILRNGDALLETEVSHATTHKVSFAFWLND